MRKHSKNNSLPSTARPTFSWILFIAGYVGSLLSMVAYPSGIGIVLASFTMWLGLMGIWHAPLAEAAKVIDEPSQGASFYTAHIPTSKAKVKIEPDFYF